ncbi:MAG: hypothetical protein GXP42_01695 [Chloroflexi bacterium]|nr:hypothetical protein [Chloroflexota bacterium]
MKTLTRLLFIMAALLLFSGVVLASQSEMEPFSTTGYTTNLVPPPVPIPGLPPLVPSDFEFLPSGHIKFRIEAQGGPAVDDDALCLALYGAPCQSLCIGYTGRGCGAAGYFDGSFTFEEWGLVDQTFAGVNYGDITMITANGQAQVQFSGQASAAGIVTGSFKADDGDGAYDDLEGEGTYVGNAGYIFTVDYTPCGGPGGPACPVDRCAVFGDELKLKKKRIEWEFENEGERTLTLSSITINWPASNGPITKVKLDGKTISDDILPPPWTTIDLSNWSGKLKDIQVKADEDAKLKFEFLRKPISQAPSDYTIEVKFAEGCATAFVAFP